MPIVVECPSCARVTHVAEDDIGASVPCPGCGADLLVTPAAANPYASPASLASRLAVKPRGMPVEVPPSVLGKFGLAFRLLGANFVTFSLLVLTVWLPGNLVIDYLSSHSPNDDALISMRMTSVIDAFFGPIAVGGLIHALDQAMRGRKATYRESLAVGLRSWGRLFLARLFSGLMILVGLLLLILPGFIFMVRYALVEPVAVLEAPGASGALGRSIDLTRGRRWKIAAAGILFSICFFALVFLIDVAAGFVDEAIGHGPVIAAQCLEDIVYVVLAITMFLFYWEARAAEAKPARLPDELLD